MEKYIFSDEARAALEFQKQPIAIYQFIDKKIVTLLVSDGFCELFGYSDRSQAVWDMDHDMYKDTHPDDRQRMANAALRFAKGDDSEEYEVVFRTKAGVESDYHVVHARGKHIYIDTDVRLAQIWYMDEGAYIEGDESAANGMNRLINSVLHEESILRSANYDILTGLPNLGYFFKLCEVGKKRVFGEGKQGCLLYIDLNGMKFYNYQHGFAEGDELLKTVARTLSSVFGPKVSCHIGADRFLVSTTEDGLENRINEFFDKFEKQEHHLPVRIGIYSTSLEDVPVSSAYDRAKLACDAIRKSEKSLFNYFTSELSKQDKCRRYIQTNIDKAISEKWIKVYYQPIVRAINSKVCEEEALARWIDPENGFMSPADFIPYLEESGLIFKLDLYVLEQVLEKIKLQMEANIGIVPQSINLSRVDFEACDIVEEIRKRVDEAGIPRNMITVEITESVIGSSLEFMKMQIERFRELGFAVWMDDFGSGYSSLEVLQSIKFDLIKFDMSFMRRLDEGDAAKIVLTELMKLAASLGVSTVCEGVETEEQVHFLQEIGCSKLQGYYFCKPIPYDDILERYKTGKQIGFEATIASDYFETLGSTNLNNLDVIGSSEEDSLKHSFDSIPVGVVEVRKDRARFVRSNASYRQFMHRIFGIDLKSSSQEFISFSATFMENVVKKCSERGGRVFFDQKLPDGFILHGFARWLDTNPNTGDIAIVVAILSISDPSEELSVDNILDIAGQIGELIPGGFYIYKANETEELMYANRTVCNIFGCENLEDFKNSFGFTFRGMIHPDDYKTISDAINQRANDVSGDQDFMECRIIRKDGEVRWISDYRQYLELSNNIGLYLVFISDSTDMHQQTESDKAIRFAVIETLTKVYDSVWFIRDVETQQFELLRVDEKMVHLIPSQEAVKIEKFYDAFVFYSKFVYEEDRDRFLEAVKPDNIVKNTEEKVVYAVPFRRVFDDGIRHYHVEFVRMDLENGKYNIVSAFKDVEEEM